MHATILANHEPYTQPRHPGLSGLFVLEKVLVQHLATDTGSSDPCWDKEEQITSVRVPLTSETMVSRNFGFPVSQGNPVSYFQAGDNHNNSSALTG